MKRRNVALILLLIFTLVLTTACGKGKKDKDTEKIKETTEITANKDNDGNIEEENEEVVGVEEGKDIFTANEEKYNDISNLTLDKFVEVTQMDEGRLEEIYNIDNYRNPNYEYKSNVLEIGGEGALNLTAEGYYKLLNHYENEYMAKKFAIEYTLQDLIEYSKSRVDISELQTMDDIYFSDWLLIQNIGWEQYALTQEYAYINEKMADYAVKKGRDYLSQEDKERAIEQYGSGLRAEGYPEEEIVERAVDLYIHTNTNWGELQNEATLYAKIKLLKELQPEKYQQIVKQEKQNTIGQIQEELDLENYD